MIQRQENQRKNNLLVLMGLVLSLPRTFQPRSRDRSGGEGEQQSQILPVSRRGDRRGAAGRSAPSAAGTALRASARRQVTRIFHSLGFITSWNTDRVRWAARGFRFPPCLFSLPCVLLPGEERSQAGQGELGRMAAVWPRGWEPLPAAPAGRPAAEPSRCSPGDDTCEPCGAASLHRGSVGRRRGRPAMLNAVLGVEGPRALRSRPAKQPHVALLLSARARCSSLPPACSSAQGTALPTPMGVRTRLLSVWDATATLWSRWSPSQQDAVMHHCFSSVVGDRGCSVPYGSAASGEEGCAILTASQERPGAALCRSAAVRRHEQGILMG